MRIIERGDMVSFDTDLVGPYGYCCDISRSWVCGAAPSNEQRRIYADAHAHIQHNKALLKSGLTFRELTERLRPLVTSSCTSAMALPCTAWGSATSIRPSAIRRTGTRKAMTAC